MGVLVRPVVFWGVYWIPPIHGETTEGSTDHSDTWVLGGLALNPGSGSRNP